LHNDMVKNIQNGTIKKKSIDFGSEKVGSLQYT